MSPMRTLRWAFAVSQAVLRAVPLAALVWLPAAVAASPAGASPEAASTLSAVDDRGVRVVLPQPPRRIVTLLPSLTETVCALGACDRLVAVDDFSNWPARVSALPRVGGLEDAQVETIVSLRPDLVLAAASTRAVARLEALGLRVAALEPRTLDDLRRTIDRVVARVGRRVDENSPMVDARLPDGSRFNAIIPPLALDGSAVSIRKFSREALTLERMVALGTLTPEMGQLLQALVQAKLNAQGVQP